MHKRKRLVTSAEFQFGRGKSLVISISSHIGLDRIIVENKNGIVHVRAEGHSRFEFNETKKKPSTSSMCDFWLGNPSLSTALEDYLESKFWGQFTWGKLFEHKQNAKLKKAIKEEIQKLVGKFEPEAARRLNAITRKTKKDNR